jgi:uncharacterized membrane protein YeaQ/YmgE (transglycosylase-associated protein family)
MLTKCAKNANFTEAAFAEHQGTARTASRFLAALKSNFYFLHGTFYQIRDLLAAQTFLSGSRRQREERMSIIGWIVLGLIAGFIASKIVNKQGEGIILDIVLGIVGAIVGGYLFSMFGAQGVSGVNIYSMFVAVVGAIVVLVIYHSVAGRRTA